MQKITEKLTFLKIVTFNVAFMSLLILTKCENPIPEIEAQFYDLKTKEPFMTISDGLRTETQHVMKANGCDCQDLTCGCCMGMNIGPFSLNREGCMNFFYDPQGFALGMNMIFNNESLFNNSISAKNPPPLCMPIPLTFPGAPAIDVCMKLFDIYTPGQNLHMCMDFLLRFQRVDLFVVHFDCMSMGMDGLSLSKPDIDEEADETMCASGDSDAKRKRGQKQRRKRSKGVLKL